MEKLPARFYPFESGKAGIPFEEIFTAQSNGCNNGFIIGGSGSKLKFEIGTDWLHVVDDVYRDRFLCARRKRADDVQVIGFNLQTRTSDLDRVKGDFPWKRHPDMHAKLFIGVALEHFRKMGVKIDACEGNWNIGSVNHSVYVRQLLVFGKSPSEAARETWSGKVFSSYGFARIEDKDVVHTSYPDGHGGDEIRKVRATFYSNTL